jgi:hypothetical protein
MADGVLRQGLKQHVGKFGVVGLGVNIEDDGQAVGKAGLFNPQVALNEIQFLPDGAFLEITVFQAEAQEVAEFADHPVGGFDIYVHEGGNRVEGVEQEMRLELDFE